LWGFCLSRSTPQNQLKTECSPFCLCHKGIHTEVATGKCT
jgi:hypothetical protein